MSGLFGGKNQVNDTTPPATALRVQSSIAGKAIPVVVGQVRLGPNLIDDQDFASQQISSGGGGGGGGKGGGGSCVAGETLVAMPGGAKRIDQLAPGDLIWSLDPDSGNRVAGRVEQVLKHDMAQLPDKLLRVDFFGSDRPLFITTNHYPWIDGTRRREMKDWCIGEELLHLDSGFAVISSMRDAPAAAFTYNLVVAPHHNFFAEGVLLHNGFSSGGGKGNTQTTYTVVPVYGVCEGPIAGFYQMWNGQSPTSLAALNFTGYVGDYPGEMSGYMETKHPANALPYPGLARVEATPLQLGTSDSLPNINVEVLAAINGLALNGVIVSADPSLWIADLLTNANYGVGFPSARLGDLSTYSAFCITNLLLVSDAMTDQRALNDYLNDLAEATYSEFVFVDGGLTVIPRGMQATGGFGIAYIPPAVDYTLSIDDFLPNTNATGTSAASTALSNDPVIWVTAERSTLDNQITVNCYDRQNSYNPNPQIAQNLAAIQAWGLRAGDPKQYSFFTDTFASIASAHYQLEEAQIDKTCCFTLGMKYARVMPMSILAGIPLPQNVGTTTVRVVEITQNQDFTFSVTAEEYPVGGIAPQQYNSENPNPTAPGINTDPGLTTAYIFEPLESLAGDPEIWIMANGASEHWRGCDVYLSFDNQSYLQIGSITNAARAGVLTAPLPAITPASFGQTVDTTDTLSVALQGNNDELAGGTLAEALQLSTLCYVDGELLAYQNATLTGAGAYNLTTLVRGAYGTTIGAHLAATQFARIDNNDATIVKLPYTPDRVGQVCYLKFVAVNTFGGGDQELAGVPFHVYVVQGSAVTAPLPDVEGLQQTVDVNNVVELIWETVTDTLPVPRPVDYEIRFGGASWTSATFIGRTAATSFAVPSDGLFWVAAHYSPVAGVDVYSAAASLTVTIPLGLQNLLVQSIAEAAPAPFIEGSLITPFDTFFPDSNLVLFGAWTPFYNQMFPNGGQPYGFAVSDGVARLQGLYLALGDSGDFFAPADFFAEANPLYQGGIKPSGRYVMEFGSLSGFKARADSTVVVVASYIFAGVPIYGDFFSLPDFFYGDDFLQWTLAQRASLTFQYGLSSNAFVEPTSWVAFQPGQQIRVPAGETIFLSALIETSDPSVQPILSHLNVGIFGVDQVERFQDVATAAAVTLAMPRNDRPNIALVPLDQQSGDVLTVTWQQSSGSGTNQPIFGGGGFLTGAYTGFTLGVTNGGVAVTRHFDCAVIGF
jgi:hypothetical protein